VVEGGLNAAALAEIDWRLVLGEVELDESELERLAAAKAPLTYLRGQWVAFRAEQVAQALTALGRHRRAHPLLDPVSLLHATSDGGGDVPVEVDAQPGSWVDDVLAGLPDDRVEPLPEPPGFTGTLRHYQRQGLGWLAFLTRLGLGGCLADDMGLGKTAQVLALLAHERGVNTPGTPTCVVAPTLVVCPLSVVRNWETEAERFTPSLRVFVHHGQHRLRGEELLSEVATADLVVTTYATAAKDADDLAQTSWRRIVADEAQHVKNAATGAARALRRIPATQRLALTGTPVENRLGELWSLCDLTTPGLLGNATDFRRRFAVPIERHRDDEATDRLRRLVSPFILRRSKADKSIVPELPPKVEQVAWATLTREQASLYRAVVDVLFERLRKLDGIERRGAILAAVTRLKQICNHPAHYLADGSRLEGRSGKLARFDELVVDIRDAEASALVFTQYREMGHLLVTHLSDRHALRAPFLHGGVARARRDAMVEQFQAGAGGPLLLVSLKAGGSGLNLTAATQVIHYDRWWNPAVEDQASDRAWRIGQHQTVLVHKLACQGTIEERVDALITSKRDLADRVVGTGEGWVTELSTEELRDLLVLREDRR
jgi:SNF2 family DNA or RNA helicase